MMDFQRGVAEGFVIGGVAILVFAAAVWVLGL